ncbi:hypothetical protein [uncultured Tateyamaria sp.]|uniref:hypothetical protein n=1 Tax=uncultured Tateyamaria sp. TaxID=455651 RepID=UPI002637C1A5|nr:hypothetical protein [uncultured Tateyamaria sp.]
MRSYDAARGSFSFFEILARIVVGIGLLAALLGAALAAKTGGNGPPNVLFAALGTIPGGFIALAGFYGLVMAQMGRASVDGAEYAQLSLSVARQQLELSQEALALSKSQAQPTYATKLATATASATQATAPTASPDSTGQSSYADRPMTEPSVVSGADGHLDAAGEPNGLGSEASQAAPQLEHKTAVLLPELNGSEPANAEPVAPSPATQSAVAEAAVDTALVYHNGHFLVGGKPFKTKGEALAYQSELQAKETS